MFSVYFLLAFNSMITTMYECLCISFAIPLRRVLLFVTMLVNSLALSCLNFLWTDFSLIFFYSVLLQPLYAFNTVLIIFF